MTDPTRPSEPSAPADHRASGSLSRRGAVLGGAAAVAAAAVALGSPGVASASPGGPATVPSTGRRPGAPTLSRTRSRDLAYE